MTQLGVLVLSLYISFVNLALFMKLCKNPRRTSNIAKSSIVVFHEFILLNKLLVGIIRELSLICETLQKS